jgi:membrane protease YdiL (CAAX protease family)
MDALRAARSSVYPIARIAVILYILWRGGDLEILGSPKPAWLADISIAVGAIVVGSLIANLMLWMAALGGSPRPHYASSAAWSHSAPAAVVAGSMFNLLIAIASEVFYRGYLIRRLQTLFRSTFFAVAASCVLYSVVYLQYGVVGGIVPSVLGLILALVFLKTNRLWPVIFAHYFVLMYGWLR